MTDSKKNTFRVKVRAGMITSVDIEGPGVSQNDAVFKSVLNIIQLKGEKVIYIDADSGETIKK